MTKFEFFCIDGKAQTPIEGKKGGFKLASIVVEAPTVEEAYELAEPQIPEGGRVWCWMIKSDLKGVDPTI